MHGCRIELFPDIARRILKDRMDYAPNSGELQLHVLKHEFMRKLRQDAEQYLLWQVRSARPKWVKLAKGDTQTFRAEIKIMSSFYHNECFMSEDENRNKWLVDRAYARAVIAVTEKEVSGVEQLLENLEDDALQVDGDAEEYDSDNFEDVPRPCIFRQWMDVSGLNMLIDSLACLHRPLPVIHGVDDVFRVASVHITGPATIALSRRGHECLRDILTPLLGPRVTDFLMFVGGQRMLTDMLKFMLFYLRMHLII